MNESKLSSDEVPAKFADWLLAMGCPPEKVPPVEKISEMCRGTYYLVWRNLMEQVESKDIIKQKRLQVFADDVERCKKKNLFTERDTNVLIPPELTLWRQQTDVREKVAEAESRVAEARRNLNEVMDKVSSKMAQRNLAHQKVQDLQRRGWLLQLLAEDLGAKKQHLAEARTIAEDVCRIGVHADVKGKLDACLQLMRRSPSDNGVVASFTMIGHNPSSLINGDTDDENIMQLVHCRADAVWAELYARRAGLVASLADQAPSVPDNRLSFQSVLTHTASLQCSLTLEALKCREMTRLAQTRFGQAINELNYQLTTESCELLVLRCEQARMKARVDALRSLLSELSARNGAFRTTGGNEDVSGTRGEIDRIDKAIVSKKEEIKTVIHSLSTIERKIQNVRECLAAIFDGFQRNVPTADSNRGIQLDLPSESIASLRRFYEQRRERRREKTELSMEFDTTDNSFNDSIDLNNARFVDELKIYLKKFNLEKNRKVVLDSGEKFWIFETIESSVQRLHSKLQSEDITCSLVCPSGSVVKNMMRLAQEVALRNGLGTMGKGGRELDIVVDINKHTNEEERIIDNIKKRLDENLRSLQKTNKTLEEGSENLCLWSDNKIKDQISDKRTVDGKPYKTYEAYYLESLHF